MEHILPKDNTRRQKTSRPLNSDRKRVCYQQINHSSKQEHPQTFSWTKWGANPSSFCAVRRLLHPQWWLICNVTNAPWNLAQSLDSSFCTRAFPLRTGRFDAISSDQSCSLFCILYVFTLYLAVPRGQAVLNVISAVSSWLSLHFWHICLCVCLYECKSKFIKG